ncbi:hypothetical protein CMI42_01695 [Candidatus Pacearchaeota archaeon]|nr:hypothetical protein [Candidatus Pacearchaeota archaeon]|tara:strand:- start:1149 stop:1403 length:255 start_codon:yes stop_codon:yes gene_type:complete
MENNDIDIYYDDQGDFLELSFGIPPKTEYAEDVEDDVFVTRDRETNEIKSLGILNFRKRAREAILKKVLKRLDISIPLDISASS